MGPIPRRFLDFLSALAVASLLIAIACGGGDDKADPTGSAPADASGVASSPATTSAPSASPANVGDGDGSEAVDACSLLTTAEVEAVVGDPVATKTGNVGPPLYACDWETENINEQQGFGFEEITVQVLSSSRDVVEASYDLSSTIADQEIDSVGEKAQWLAGVNGKLEFLQGKYHVSVFIKGFGEEPAQIEIAKQLATAVSSRLES